MFCFQYQKTIEELITEPKKHNRNALIAQIKMEQRYSGALYNENSELRIAIQTHRKAMDDVMDKYREQMKTFKEIKELELRYRKQLNNDTTLERRQTYMENIKNDLPAVLSYACDKDAILIQRQRILIDKIKMENEKMRRALIGAENLES